MSIDSSMGKVLKRRQEVETQLAQSLKLSNKELADFSRELSELIPVCDQIELIRRLEVELEEANGIVLDSMDDNDMQTLVEAEIASLKDQIVNEKARLQHFLLPMKQSE